MKIINLFGAPGAGKSTTSAGVFHLLKLQGVNCELVTEYAKEMVWRNLPPTAFEDQLYITAKQNAKLERLRGKVEYVITDSPILLGLAYTPATYHNGYTELLKSLFSSYNNINFYLNRVKNYNPIGRNQSEEESDAVGVRIKNILMDNSIRFKEIDGGKTAAQNIINSL